MTGDPELTRYHARWHRWARFVAQRGLLAPVVRSVADVSVQGTENLEGLDGSFVVVTNHSSHLDAPLVVTALPYRMTKQLAVNAAADYFYQQWWKKALTSLFFNTFPVHRNVAGMKKTKAMSAKLLGEEIPVLIFPEGTRSRDGTMRRFKPGAAALCIAHDVACVPIAIVGAHDAMPVGRFWPIWGRPPVTMIIGAPVRPEPEENLRGFNERVEGIIATMLATGTPSRADSGPSGRPTNTQGLDHPHEEAS